MSKPVATFSISGDRQLQRGLASLSPVVQRKVVRPAIQQSATIVSKAMKANAKRIKKTGALAKSIGRRMKTYKETVVASVGPRVGWRQGSREPGNYDYLVEDGTKSHTIRPVSSAAMFSDSGRTESSKALEDFRTEIGHPGSPPQPFVRSAVESTRSQVIAKQASVLREKLAIEAKRHIDKQARKAARSR